MITEKQIDLIDRAELIENLNRFAPEQYNALVNMIIQKQVAVETIRLPCKPGDTVYYLAFYGIEPMKVCFVKCQIDLDSTVFIIHAKTDDGIESVFFGDSDIGEFVFLTKEAAENAFKERKK